VVGVAGLVASAFSYPAIYYVMALCAVASAALSLAKWARTAGHRPASQDASGGDGGRPDDSVDQSGGR
jgi:hypothetical protein